MLTNGLEVVLCPRPALASTYVAVYFGVGSRHESPENNGITHVLEHMLFRGSGEHRESTALNRAAEDCGGFLDGATYRDHLVFSSGCHPSTLPRVIEILGSVVQSPRYRGIEIERAILREELLETVDRDGRMIDLDNIAHATIFAKHGLGLPIEGTLANLESFTRRELEAHRARFLVARNAVLSIAGPMPRVSRIMAAAERAFGQMPEGQPAQDGPPPRPRPSPLVRYVRNSASQVDLRLSFWTVPMTDPAYPPLVLLGRLLADGLASRLHAELVDKRGLAYALHAGHTTYNDCGLFDLEVSVAPNRASEVASRLLDFAAASSHMRFGREELDRVLRRYRYGMEFMSDDACELAGFYGRAALFRVEPMLEALYDELARLENPALSHAAARFLVPERLALTAVGELARGERRRLQAVVRERATSLR